METMGTRKVMAREPHVTKPTYEQVGEWSERSPLPLHQFSNDISQSHYHLLLVGDNHIFACEMEQRQKGLGQELSFLEAENFIERSLWKINLHHHFTKLSVALFDCLKISRKLNILF